VVEGLARNLEQPLHHAARGPWAGRPVPRTGLGRLAGRCVPRTQLRAAGQPAPANGHCQPAHPRTGEDL